MPANKKASKKPTRNRFGNVVEYATAVTKKAVKAKRKYTKKTIKLPVPSTLEILLDLLAGVYPEDQLTPGIVVSHINKGKNAGMWYGAAYRYPGERNQFGYLKRVRIGEPALAFTFDEMVAKLASPWTARDVQPLRDVLRQRVNGVLFDPESEAHRHMEELAEYDLAYGRGR